MLGWVGKSLYGYWLISKKDSLPRIGMCQPLNAGEFEAVVITSKKTQLTARNGSLAVGDLEAVFDLDDFLPYRLSALTNRISRAFSALYSARFDLTIPEWRVMAVLGQENGLSADQVCAKTEMDKVTVSRAVTRLLGKGRLVREFASVDRRRSVLALSARGRVVYKQIIPLAREYEQALTVDLAGPERLALLALLDRLRP